MAADYGSSIDGFRCETARSSIMEWESVDVVRLMYRSWGVVVRILVRVIVARKQRFFV